MANHPHRRLTARNILGGLLTLVGVWAVVATSQEDPVIGALPVDGSIDVAAGSTAQLVFDLAATDDALAGGRVPDFRIDLIRLTSNGVGGQVTSSIVGHTEPEATANASWELSCLCDEAQVVIELELPADGSEAFATIGWTAYATIYIEEGASGAGQIELTLVESRGATLVELASGSQSPSEFSVSALDVETANDEQVWIQSTGPYDNIAIVVAPDGRRSEFSGNGSVVLECATGPCSGRFHLAAPKPRRGQELGWRVVSLSNLPTVNPEQIEVSSVVEEVGDLASFSLNRDTSVVHQVTTDVSDASAAVLDPYVHVEIFFKGSDAAQVELVNDENVGFFVPNAEGITSESLDLVAETWSEATIEAEPIIRVTLYWLPLASGSDPQLTVSAELVE